MSDVLSQQKRDEIAAYLADCTFDYWQDYAVIGYHHGEGVNRADVIGREFCAGLPEIYVCRGFYTDTGYDELTGQSEHLWMGVSALFVGCGGIMFDDPLTQAAEQYLQSLMDKA